MKGILSFSFLGTRTDEEAMWRVKLYDDHHDFDRLVKRWEDPIPAYARGCLEMLIAGKT